ncbi:low-density lipoprotein receptor-related protein 12-like [Branchiostoma lanceolatum]|uniref:low-density lipoprotein receptor-related protein 12-like n=1 Tax=Branchiostoma lanceolatum TaxID=7740 RepID=UPI0034535CD9
MGTWVAFLFFTSAVLWTGVSSYVYQTIGMYGNEGRTLSLREAGYISWTEYSYRYDDNQDFRVHFEAPLGKRIILYFYDIDIEDNDDCRYDRLEVCNGAVNYDTCPFPSIVCGTYAADFVSMGNVITIRFKSDSSNEGHFKLIYTVFSYPTHGYTCSVGDCMCSNGRCINATLQGDGVNNCGSDQVSDARTCYDAGYIHTTTMTVRPMFPTDYSNFYLSEHCRDSVDLGYSGYIQWDRRGSHWDSQSCWVNFSPPPGMQVLLQFVEVDMEGNSPSCSYDRLLVFSHPTFDNDVSPDRTICGDDDVSSYIGTSVGLKLETDSSVGGDFNILYTVFRASYSCSSGEFRCARGQMCMASSVRCDGQDNCEDGSDEYQCPSIAPPAVASSSSGVSTGIVIGAVVGALAVLFLIAALVGVICHCSRRQARTPAAARSPDPTGTPLYPTGQQATYPTDAPPYPTGAPPYPTGAPSYPTAPPGHYTYLVVNQGMAGPSSAFATQGAANSGYEPPPAYSYPPPGLAYPPAATTGQNNQQEAVQMATMDPSN